MNKDEHILLKLRDLDIKDMAPNKRNDETNGDEGI